MYEWLVYNYILSKGYEFIQKITDEDVENMKNDLENEEKKLKDTKKIMLMSPSFQVSIVVDARIICNQEKSKLMNYFKNMAKNIA